MNFYFKTLPKAVKIPTLLFTTLLLLIELCFKNWEAPNQLFYRSGILILQLCYAFVGSAIFYFITVHIPSVQRQLKTYYFIVLKIQSMGERVLSMLTAIGVNGNDIEDNAINEDLLFKYSMTFDPYKPIHNWSQHDPDFQNIFEYVRYQTSLLQQDFQSLLLLNDVIDPDILFELIRFEQSVTLVKSGNDVFWPNNIQGISRDLWSLYSCEQQLKKVCWDKYEHFRDIYQSIPKPIK